MPDYKIAHGDNLELLRQLKPNSVDAIITDTPYATELADWDEIPSIDRCRELLRVAKPGAYIAAFGAARTHHRLMVNMEAAGWEMKDLMMWLYGSGFSPGSVNIAENIDKLYGEKGTREGTKYTPASPEAREFAEFGVGLKPAWEPIVIGRKLGKDTIAENLVTYGVGAIDIGSGGVVDGRIYGATDAENMNLDEDLESWRNRNKRDRRRIPGQQRWPANVAIDADAVPIIEAFAPGASRFFFCGKASRSEREAGCTHLSEMVIGADTVDAEGDDRRGRAAHNNHPTVKPIALMRWLVRLFAPKGSVVLDPYMGSGSTGCAVGQEHERMFIGFEGNKRYFDIAEARIAHWWSV